MESFKQINAKSSSVIIDVRDPEVFCQGFIGESISIFPGDNFLVYINDLVSDEQQILFVADQDQLAALDKIIRGAGISNVAGYLGGGFDTWKNSERAIDLLIAIDAEEFALDYQFDEFFLVDVRAMEDFEKEHVEDAECIALSDLIQILPQLEISQSYYLYGQTRPEAVTAGSIFKQYGFQRVRVLLGEYEELKNTKIPFFVPKKKDKPGPPAPNVGPANR